MSALRDRSRPHPVHRLYMTRTKSENLGPPSLQTLRLLLVLALNLTRSRLLLLARRQTASLVNPTMNHRHHLLPVPSSHVPHHRNRHYRSSPSHAYPLQRCTSLHMMFSRRRPHRKVPTLLGLQKMNLAGTRHRMRPPPPDTLAGPCRRPLLWMAPCSLRSFENQERTLTTCRKSSPSLTRKTPWIGLVASRPRMRHFRLKISHTYLCSPFETKLAGTARSTSSRSAPSVRFAAIFFSPSSYGYV
jgi:hypothetical protein